MNLINKLMALAIMLGIAAAMEGCGKNVEANHGYDLNCETVRVRNAQSWNWIELCKNDEVSCYSNSRTGIFSCVPR